MGYHVKTRQKPTIITSPPNLITQFPPPPATHAPLSLRPHPSQQTSNSHLQYIPSILTISSPPFTTPSAKPNLTPKSHSNIPTPFSSFIPTIYQDVSLLRRLEPLNLAHQPKNPGPRIPPAGRASLQHLSPTLRPNLTSPHLTYQNPANRGAYRGTPASTPLWAYFR